MACYVVGLIGFREQTIYNMTTDFGNHRIYSITIDFGHSLQYNYNWRLTRKLQDVIWLQFAKKKKKDCIQLESYIRLFSFCHPTLANNFAPS